MSRFQMAMLVTRSPSCSPTKARTSVSIDFGHEASHTTKLIEYRRHRPYRYG